MKAKGARPLKEPAETLLEEIGLDVAPVGLDTRGLPDFGPLPSCDEASVSRSSAAGRQSIADGIHVRVSVELARRKISLSEAASLSSGGVVDLGCDVDAPVVVLIGDVPIARGEIVVNDERFAVRVTEILAAGNVAEEEV